MMTVRQRNIRQFLFREMIAAHDMRVCKAGHGPMVLTWREAREFWRKATNGALPAYNRETEFALAA
jgi:hypothetical protein